MTRLSIGYSDSEDRIWIALSEDDRQWWLTRRALLRWVSELARMLGRSDGTQSDAVWTVPPERRVALEHEIATREREPDAPAASDDQVSEAPRTPRRPVLASSITMTLGKQGIATTLHGPGITRLGLSRIETHRLLGALVRQARTAAGSRPCDCRTGFSICRHRMTSQASCPTVRPRAAAQRADSPASSVDRGAAASARRPPALSPRQPAPTRTSPHQPAPARTNPHQPAPTRTNPHQPGSLS
jgi:hypothetical protein